MILIPDPNLEVKFELYDKDIDSDDFLGRLVDSLSILHVLLNVHTYLRYTDTKNDTYMYTVVPTVTDHCHDNKKNILLKHNSNILTNM